MIGNKSSDSNTSSHISYTMDGLISNLQTRTVKQKPTSSKASSSHSQIKSGNRQVPRSESRKRQHHEVKSSTSSRECSSPQNKIRSLLEIPVFSPSTHEILPPLNRLSSPVTVSYSTKTKKNSSRSTSPQTFNNLSAAVPNVTISAPAPKHLPCPTRGLSQSSALPSPAMVSSSRKTKKNSSRSSSPNISDEIAVVPNVSPTPPEPAFLPSPPKHWTRINPEVTSGKMCKVVTKSLVEHLSSSGILVACK